jgi:hypothetical protein
MIRARHCRRRYAHADADSTARHCSPRAHAIISMFRFGDARISGPVIIAASR